MFWVGEFSILGIIPSIHYVKQGKSNSKLYLFLFNILCVFDWAYLKHQLGGVYHFWDASIGSIVPGNVKTAQLKYLKGSNTILSQVCWKFSCIAEFTVGAEFPLWLWLKCGRGR